MGIPLTERELTILTLAAEGFKNWQIGQRMGIKEQTVKNSLSALYRKSGARDKAHAVALAIRAELIA